MPFPEINFYLWKDEKDLCESMKQTKTATILCFCWCRIQKQIIVIISLIFSEGKLLANFALQSSFSVDEEKKNKRESIQSRDSGIVRDLKESEAEDTEQPPVSKTGPAISRRNARKSMNPAGRLSLMKEKMEAFTVHKEDRKCLTARVVVMGDDRVLGRLTRAYHSIRWASHSFHIVLQKTGFCSWSLFCISILYVHMWMKRFNFSLTVSTITENKSQNISFWPRNWTYSCTTSQSWLWSPGTIHLWVTQTDTDWLVQYESRRLYIISFPHRTAHVRMRVHCLSPSCWEEWIHGTITTSTVWERQSPICLRW